VGRFPAERTPGLGSHPRGLSQWLAGGGGRGGRRRAVIGVPVGPGFELLGPGRGRGAVPHLRRREKGEVWLGSGRGRTRRLWR